MRITLAVFFSVFPLLCAAQDALLSCRESLAAGDYAAATRLGRQAGGFDGLMCAGRALLASADYAGASAAFAEAEKLQSEPFELMLAATFHARANKGLGKLDEALEYYDQSLEIARGLGQKQAQMINLNESAQILQSRGDVKLALDRFKQAYLNAANDNERSECNHLIAIAYMQLGDYDKAIEHQLKSVVLEERSGDFNHYLNARLDFAEVLIKAKSFARAEKEINESLQQAQAAGSIYWEAKAMLYMARVQKSMAHIDQATASLEKSRQLANSSGDADLIKETLSEAPAK